MRWAVNAVAASGVAQVDDQGAFVAETPGKYTVTGIVGDRSADAVIQVEPRRVGRGMEVQGRVPLGFRAAEVWVHPSGKCAYLSTIADRVYAIDVADPSQPENRRLDDDQRASGQRRHDDRGRPVRRVLARGGVGPQERHRGRSTRAIPAIPSRSRNTPRP